MSRIHRTLPPAGTKIGIAFSGGLDTRCAVAWLARKGLEVYAYTADLAQPDEETPSDIPPVALQHGAEGRAPDRLPRRAGARGADRHPVRRLPPRRPAARSTSTRRRSAARSPTTAIVRAMSEDDVNVFGDGSTHKGNDIQRFYRYGILTNPALTIYKPWLDQQFVDAFGGRKEMSEYLNGIGLPYRMGVEKAYSTDANLLGATHEAKDLEHLDKGMRIVNPIMGVAFWKPEVAHRARGGHGRVRAGRAGRRQRQALRVAFELFSRRNRIGGRHGLGMSDQIENRVIDAKSRGIYEAPGDGAAAHRLRAPAVGDPQREHDSTCTTRWAAASAACSTRASGSTPRR